MGNALVSVAAVLLLTSLAGGKLSGSGETSSRPLAGPQPDVVRIAQARPERANRSNHDGRGTSNPQADAKAGKPDRSGLTPRARKLIDERDRRDKNVWKPEVDAQAYEHVFMSMWDALRANGHRFNVLETVRLNRIAIPESKTEQSLDYDILETTYGVDIADGEGIASGAAEKWLDQTEFAQWLAELQSAGYRLHESEWHHSEFQPAGTDSAAVSLISFLLHVTGPDERIVFRGKLQVRWTANSSPAEPVIGSIRVIDLKRWGRKAPVAFESVSIDPQGEARPARAQPLIVYDLDGDGLSEIMLGESNVLYRNLGAGAFSKEQFLKPSVGSLMSGIVADFDRDGRPDYVCIGRDFLLHRYEVDENGRFEQKSERVCKIRFDRPQVFSAGDVDGDGDLDLWLGQYMPPYVMGQMPRPYYDANDGFPDYLLINDGTGKFTDGTEHARLTAKARRRTYAGSLVDLNDDGHVDLIVISDFSGVDIYHNDGTGRFIDVTARVLPERHTFGMSYSLADYDRNGKLDVYVVGMSSTTARRLSKLGLGLESHRRFQEMRPIMGYGNRMYLNSGSDRFTIPKFNNQVARTGWSWGCSSFDFDNDGDRDIYIANGHRSGESCQDYCTKFWRHDIYLEPTGFDQDVREMFGAINGDLDSGKISWNGYEHNKLLMNRGGTNFVDVAWLMGVAFEADSRAVVTDDLDGDGRVDLLVTEYKIRGNRETYRLKVLRNTMETGHHWIGVRLRDSAEGGSAIGAMVTVNSGDRPQITRVVTGDSFTAQHAPVVHFGLRDRERVESLTVKWADGRSVTLNNPDADRYHDLSTATGN